VVIISPALSLHSQSGSELPRPAFASPYRFGKYTLLAKLAQGGMGEVFAALLSGEAGFEKLVVIKRILPHLAEDPRFVSMFLAEARVTASLTHPNICQVFELGQIDGEYYLAMEYLEGVSLARLIRQNANRGLDLRLAAGIVCQMLEGLQFAHCFRQPGQGMVGIVHRDLSPSNVFVTTAGLVKVLDFGVAKVQNPAATTATGLKGKYPYMAPEQIKSQDLDGRADLFSAGILLFEVVTGRSLFHRQSDFDTLMAVVSGERPSLAEIRPDVPLGLEEVIDRSLQVVREERYSSAREMSEALVRALEPLSGVATSRELGDLVRRDCANDLEEERDRIHNASTYLKSLVEQGQEPPVLAGRRSRSLLPLPAAALEPLPPPISIAIPAPLPISTSEAAVGDITSATQLHIAAMRAARRRRVVLPLLISAGLLAGAAGWWLRGSPDPATAVSDRTTPAAGAQADQATTDGISGGAIPGSATTGTAPTGTATIGTAPTGTGATTGTAATGTGAGASPIGSSTAKEGVAGSATGTPSQASDATTGGAARESESGRAGGEPDRTRRTRRAGARRAERAAAQLDTGYFSVDALPYAQVYIDGVFAGITPLVRIPLKPGRHSVRAVAESGASERLTITVRAGETVSRRIRLETLRP
jgi:serine/threonine-protein kinase